MVSDYGRAGGGGPGGAVSRRPSAVGRHADPEILQGGGGVQGPQKGSSMGIFPNVKQKIKTSERG